MERERERAIYIKYMDEWFIFQRLHGAGFDSQYWLFALVLKTFHKYREHCAHIIMYVCMCMHVCMYVCMYVCVCMYVRVCVNGCINVFMPVSVLTRQYLYLVV